MIRIEFPPALFTRELAAYYLSMSVREIDDLRHTKEITAVGTGKRVKFRKADLDRIADRMPDRDADPAR
jgi:excisionase family DNA binding protein